MGRGSLAPTAPDASKSAGKEASYKFDFLGQGLESRMQQVGGVPGLLGFSEALQGILTGKVRAQRQHLCTFLMS